MFLCNRNNKQPWQWEMFRWYHLHVDERRMKGNVALKALLTYSPLFKAISQRKYSNDFLIKEYMWESAGYLWWSVNIYREEQPSPHPWRVFLGRRCLRNIYKYINIYIVLYSCFLCFFFVFQDKNLSLERVLFNWRDSRYA